MHAFEGHPATGKKFAVDGAEYIIFSAPGLPAAKGSGGGMYYSPLTILEQLGRVNRTNPAFLASAGVKLSKH